MHHCLIFGQGLIDFLKGFDSQFVRAGIAFVGYSLTRHVLAADWSARCIRPPGICSIMGLQPLNGRMPSRTASMWENSIWED